MEEARMHEYTVGYFVGSLAKESLNRKLSLALTRLAPKSLTMREIPIDNLPLYSYDYDPDYPPVARALKESIASADAVLFVTPEYNRSIPGSLKNAIDWASRPYGKNLLCAETVGDHRHVPRQDRHGRRPTAPQEHPRLLQLAADERDRGLHPVHARSHHR
jgi:NAD(P)H-dependent FMN reductase